MNNNQWKWQVSNSIRNITELKKYIDLSPEEIKGISMAEKEFSWCITPYYAKLMSKNNPDCPIRMQAIPRAVELDDPLGVMDPLEEEKHEPAPNIIKVYPDRIAWCVSNSCPVLCRYCLRKRMVGRESFDFSRQSMEEAFDYIRNTPAIRDVLVTGGDPLMYEDSVIEKILSGLSSIDHVEIIRIGTRTPCTMPQRITKNLCNVLRKYHPLWINTQFNHPQEFTKEAIESCTRLIDAGIPLGNQSVLLHGINDTPEIMKNLVQGLVKMRIRPYYIYQCQTLAGTAHFRTPVETGIKILDTLRGYTTGFSVPTYVLDTPYGKIPMAPNYIVKRDSEAVYLRNFEGKIWREPNPANKNGIEL